MEGGKEERQSRGDACFKWSLEYLQVWKRNHENPSHRSTYTQSPTDARPRAAPLVSPAVLICAPSEQILLSEADLCCANNPRFKPSLDQDTTERAEGCDGEPRDAVKIPGNQSPGFRSSPSNIGGTSVLSFRDSGRKCGMKVFPAFDHSVD